MAYDYPEAFFAPPLVRFARDAAVAEEDLADAAAAAARGEAAADRRRRRRAVRAGDATRCARSRRRTACRSPRRRRGKGALPWDHPLQLGAIGVTGLAGRERARAATRTSCSPSARACRISRPARTRCSRRRRSSSINVNAFDALKWRGAAAASPMRAAGSRRCRSAVDGWRADPAWTRTRATRREATGGRRRCD